jgi:hypothetical protein
MSPKRKGRQMRVNRAKIAVRKHHPDAFAHDLKIIGERQWFVVAKVNSVYTNLGTGTSPLMAWEAAHDKVAADNLARALVS